MTDYKGHLITAMTELGKHSDTCCIGYNCRFGKAGGTLDEFPEDHLFEMPLAENLMAGASIGLSLDGWVPILWVERFDFFLPMADAIVNHLAQMATLSRDVHRPAVIIRVAVGNKNAPLFTGPVHTQNFSEAIRHMVSFPVIELRWKTQIIGAYQSALAAAREGRSTMLVEFRDLMNS